MSTAIAAPMRSDDDELRAAVKDAWEQSAKAHALALIEELDRHSPDCTSAGRPRCACGHDERRGTFAELRAVVEAL